MRQQDPVQEALRSVSGKNRQRFRVFALWTPICVSPYTYAARYVAVAEKCAFFACILAAATRSCAGGSSLGLRNNRQCFRIQRACCLPSKPTNPFLLLLPSIRGKVPTFPARRPFEPNTKLICGFSTNHKRLKQRPGVLSRNAVML